MWEEDKGFTKMKGLLLFLTIIPPIMMGLVFFLTEGFNLNPNLPPPLYSIVPLILMSLSIFVCILTYLTAKEEEPEWSSTVYYKFVEAVSLSLLVICVVFIALVITTYFISWP